MPKVNPANKLSEFTIPKGTTILKGKVASQVGDIGFSYKAVGGGTHIYLPNPNKAKFIKDIII